MPHWLDKVLDIYNADTINLRELAKIAGANPEFFYVGTSMRNVDVKGQDLTGIRFSDQEKRALIYDESTKFDEYSEPEEDTGEAALKANIDYILSIKNESERLAIIIEFIMKNPKKMRAIENIYKDKSHSNNIVVKSLLGDALYIDLFGPNMNREKFKLFLRNHLLDAKFHNISSRALYVAKYLGNIPDVRAQLIKIINSPNISQAHKSEIVFWINDAEKKPQYVF